MMFVNHMLMSQGFLGGLLVGVWEAKASGGDELGFHVRIAGALSHKDHYVTPTGVPGVVLPLGVLLSYHGDSSLIWIGLFFGGRHCSNTSSSV